VLGDVRFALRTFAKRPSFAVAAIGTLALGIAVNTLVFSLLNSLALRPLPVPSAAHAVRIYPVDASGRRENLFSVPDYDDYRRDASAFETLAAYIPADMTAGRSSLDHSIAEPRAVLGYVVSPNYFNLAGITTVAGRVLQDADERAGSRVAVLGHAFWQARFGGDARAVGASLMLNGEPFTIVGVASPDFHGTEPLVADVWVPLPTLPIAVPGASTLNRDTGEVLLLGWLRPGVTVASAQTALGLVTRGLASTYPGRLRPATVDVARATFFTLDAGLKPIIAMVLAVVGLVLVVACANVANLALARAVSRQREIAVRLAIGASRARIIRQLAAESLLIGFAAGAAGLLIAVWTLRLLYGFGVSLVPFAWTIMLDLTPDARVFAYTTALAIAGAVMLGILPALQSSSPDIVAALRDEVGGGRLRGSSVRHGLVVVEIAASFVLLIGAGLLLRGLHRARALDLGFSAAGVVYAEQDLRAAGYLPARARAFNDALVERAGRVPGVTSVALASHVPLHGGVRRASVTILDRAGAAPETTIVAFVSPEYFATLRIPITTGRTFALRDSSAAIVSEGLARRFWPDGGALGRSVRIEGMPGSRTIVGVVRDAANGAIWREKEMALYLPARDATDPLDLHLIALTTGEPGALARQLDADAAAIDPNVRFSVVPLSALLGTWMLPSRVAAAGASVLAGIALVLACIGVYGVVSFTISHRMREFGIRMALGADARGIITLILRDGGRLVAAGLLIGSACAVPAAPLLGRLLFDVSAFDPLTMAAVPVALTLAALGACYLPARRVSRLEPTVVLRVD
jgi:predicted permease